MKLFCLEQLQESGWFLLPKKLYQEHLANLDHFTALLYAHLTASADINYQVMIPFESTCDLLACTETILQKALWKLEDMNLIKPIGDVPHVTYQFLWTPPHYLGSIKVLPTVVRSNDTVIKTNDIDKLQNAAHFPTSMNNSDLARELALALNDMENLPAFYALVNHYPEKLLRKKLAKVLSIPSHKVKRSRAALFTFLVQQSDAKSSNDIHWD